MTAIPTLTAIRAELGAIIESPATEAFELLSLASDARWGSVASCVALVRWPDNRVAMQDAMTYVVTSIRWLIIASQRRSAADRRTVSVNAAVDIDLLVQLVAQGVQ